MRKPNPSAAKVSALPVSPSAGNPAVNNVKNMSGAGRMPARQPARRPSSAQAQQQVRRTANIQQQPARRPDRQAARMPQQQVRRPSSSANAKPQRQVHNKTREPAQAAAPMDPQQSAKLIKGLIIAIAAVLLGLLAYGAVTFFRDETSLINQEVTIEAGSVRPDLNMFFAEEPQFPKLVSCNLNFEEVNINLPQTVTFNINMYGGNFPCKLIIADTIPPVGQGIAQKIFACEELPDALSCITGIEDVTDVAATWKNVPDMSLGGSFIVQASLTDGCGNETLVDVPFEVTKDSTGPVIAGTRDIEIYVGDNVTYRNNVVITDDYDENPELTIDTAGVDLNKSGKYDVTYTAKDFSGNETSVTIKLTVHEKPEGYVEPEVVYAAAKEILDSITEPGMTEEEVALQIVWWCRYNIRFILRTNSKSWTEAAYNAFKTHTGNCYSTAYAVKALLDVAGIENMIIERYPYQTATHFWNYVKLNGEWYHCDATWREGYDSYFFMYTTKELQDFWQGGWNGFQYKKDKFPESASKSVQKKIDYKNHKIKET